MKVVILCGGQGTRLREETEFKPKPLVNVGEMPILWHIMKHYSHYGFKEFVLCLGYKGNLIKQFFLHYDSFVEDFHLSLKDKSIEYTENSKIEDWKITFADTGAEANTGARIKKIQKYIGNEPFFLTYGDGVGDVDINKLLEFHKKQGSIGTVTAVRPLSRFGVIDINEESGMIESYKKKDLHMHKGWIDGGFFVFQPEIFNYLSEDDDCMLEKEPLIKLAEDKKFSAYRHEGFWQCMDTIKQMELLNDLWKKGAPWKIW